MSEKESLIKLAEKSVTNQLQISVLLKHYVQTISSLTGKSIDQVYQEIDTLETAQKEEMEGKITTLLD